MKTSRGKKNPITLRCGGVLLRVRLTGKPNPASRYVLHAQRIQNKWFVLYTQRKELAMRVYEVSDISFTVCRHMSGGNAVISFGDSAFLRGDAGTVVIRQRGSKARLAFITVWAKFAPVNTPNGDLIEDYDLKVGVTEVHSRRVQSHLRALKKRGYVPFSGLTVLDVHRMGGGDESRKSAFDDLFDTLRWARDDGLHVDNVWVTQPGASVVRDEWHAVATAVVMVGGEFNRGEDVDRSAAIDGYNNFVARLGLVKQQ